MEEDKPDPQLVNESGAAPQPSTLADLEEENRRLRRSLENCHSIVEDCRAKLAATGEASFLVPVKSKRSAPPPKGR